MYLTLGCILTIVNPIFLFPLNAHDNPVIVAEKSIVIPELSVGEAVMRMDLENLPALMFKNAATGRMNVVYYRKDGNISWVDSK